jgi:N-acyl-D-amino-acid deacylase
LKKRFHFIVEIVNLAKVAAANGGVYATHMRYEGTKVNEAIDEALTIGREANIWLHESAAQCCGFLTYYAQSP